MRTTVQKLHEALARVVKGLNRDEHGFIFTIPIVLMLLGVGGFFLWGMASINWQGILAVFAAGVIVISTIGFFFFEAKFEYVLACSLIALAIVFVVEVSFPVLVGGLVVLAVVWNLKWLSKKPIMMGGLVILGLAMMLFVKLAMMGA